MALRSFQRNEREQIRVNVAIAEDQKEFLDEHNLNRSRLTRKMLDEIMQEVSEADDLSEVEEVTIEL